MRRPLVLGTAVGIVAALLVWYFAAFSPQSHQVQALHDQVSSLQAKQSSLEERLAALKRAQQQQPQRQQVLSSLTQAIPPTADIAGFIDQVNSLASSTGVTLGSLAPSLPTATPGESYLTITVSAQITGTYAQTVSFLEGLYSLPRLVVVDAITIGGAGSNPSPSQALTTTLKMRIFTTASPSSALK
jgi:Tfp pilus assembly protein PilO